MLEFLSFRKISPLINDLNVFSSLIQAFSNVMTKILINKPKIDEIIKIITLGIKPNFYIYIRQIE